MLGETCSPIKDFSGGRRGRIGDGEIELDSKDKDIALKRQEKGSGKANKGTNDCDVRFASLSNFAGCLSMEES